MRTAKAKLEAVEKLGNLDEVKEYLDSVDITAPQLREKYYAHFEGSGGSSSVKKSNAAPKKQVFKLKDSDGKLRDIKLVNSFGAGVVIFE